MTIISLPSPTTPADRFADLERSLYQALSRVVATEYARDSALARVEQLERDLAAERACWRATAQEAALWKAKAEAAESEMYNARLELDVVTGAADARA